ncbi:M10 family metallopeptidase C-terminal domain-containing protein [Abyssibius alkaniclasticus]|uniref:calcium-binding protein n=1 Tax=Abyssibius alkaniclasticus TaxID=2881234 RepID=UPI00236465C5|nr:calcium-binding protein [Abyssibius alkaniclasticus]UPH70495.1 M10 family metallopeptidase C-terminal domain-containing protein [Abyssibius alkaniclasticus]
MSYFSQFENTYGNYTPATALTLMAADVIALRNVYGTTGQTRTGDTRYGYMSDADGPVGDWLEFGNPTVMVVIDDGGEDVFDFSQYDGEQTIDLREEAFSNVLGEIGTVGISRGSVIENAIGGSGVDHIYGNDVGNALKGKNGNDELFGFGGADRLNGGKGTDFIYGGGGKDTIKGGGANDEIYGDGGDDTIFGGSGRDTIIGGNGNDIIYGNGGGDALKGGGGNDILIGGKGNDRLIGGTGNDLLDGGIGNDILRGGDGDDQFVFNAADAGTDTLRDYGFGNDQIIIEGAGAVDSFTNDGTDIFIMVGVQTIIVEGGVAAGLTLGDLNFA